MSDVRKRYLERTAAPGEESNPTPAKPHPVGRPRQAIVKPEETALFQAAAAILEITPKKYAPIFGVTRQTVSKWLHGVTAPKPGAFVVLVKLLVEREHSVETMGKRLDAHEERLTAALMQAQEIRAQLKEIKHDVFVGGKDK